MRVVVMNGGEMAGGAGWCGAAEERDSVIKSSDEAAD